MERRARLVYCVRARMQICKFVVKHKRAPACRSSAWDVVRQKAVKRPWALVVPGPLTRSPACKVAYACVRVGTRTSFRARSLRLFASVRSPLFKSPLFRTPLFVPRHRLKRSSAKIIKSASALRGPIDPVNSVTTTTRASLDAENALLCLFALLSPLPTSSSRLAIERTPKGLWLSKSYRPVVKLYVRARTRGDSDRRQ